MSRTLSLFFCLVLIVATIIAATITTVAEASSSKLKLTKSEREALLAQARKTNLRKKLRIPMKKESSIIAAGSPTQNPIPQATSQVIMISNFCANSSLYLDRYQSDMTHGGFEFPPADEIKVGESETFSAVPDPGQVNEEMQGNTLYYGDGFVIDVAFALEKGEWEVEVSYPTIADVGLIGSVSIGKRAFYNIITGGKNAGGEPSQC